MNKQKIYDALESALGALKKEIEKELSLPERINALTNAIKVLNEIILLDSRP